MGEESRRSSILFGIHSESKALQELERVRRQNRRLRLLAALTIILLVAALIGLIVYDFYTIQNRADMMMPPQSWQSTEVELTPQETRRWGKEQEEADMNDDEALPEEKHANHRYSESFQERTGIRPRPFHLPDKNASNILPGFTPPVRFRGVYIHPTQQPDERNQEYYQKINNLFTNNHEDKEPTPTENSHLYTKAIFPNWNRKNSKPARKPFTVMLDIYPMDKEDNRFLIDGQRQKPRDTVFLPMRYPIEQETASTMQYMLPPKPKKGRMFMKLNLFPKGGRTIPTQRRTWTAPQEDYDYDEDEEDEEEDEDDEIDQHGCKGIVGHNPFGKPVTAKWKSNNGEWVHAKYVSLNQYDPRK